jgi:hypothetical protein
MCLSLVSDAQIEKVGRRKKVKTASKRAEKPEHSAMQLSRRIGLCMKDSDEFMI